MRARSETAADPHSETAGPLRKPDRTLRPPASCGRVQGRHACKGRGPGHCGG